MTQIKIAAPVLAHGSGKEWPLKSTKETTTIINLLSTICKRFALVFRVGAVGSIIAATMALASAILHAAPNLLACAGLMVVGGMLAMLAEWMEGKKANEIRWDIYRDKRP